MEIKISFWDRSSYNWQNIYTLLRGIIAFVVIWVSFRLTIAATEIAQEWEAVLLIVIGYYFKDRPREEALKEVHYNDNDMDSSLNKLSIISARLEMLTQFILSLLLIGATVFTFIFTEQDSISGAWIGAVVLAVGFYFQETQSPQLGTIHEFFRASIAVGVVSSTLFFVIGSSPSVPLQWIGIVFIVVAFYFKEKVSGRPSNIKNL